MGLWEDIRFAGRLLLKDRWFTMVAAVALAMGIGVNATVFTFVNAVLIRGLPIAEPDRTMAVDSYDRVRNRGMGVSYLDYRDWREQTRTFESFGAYNGTVANVSDEGQPPERFNGSHISANGFAILGQHPILGRAFTPDDDRRGAAPVVLSGLEEQLRNARSLQTFGRLAAGVSRQQALSAVGLYAVTAYAVAQRTQEIGIRMALGAQGNQVSWLFLRRSFVQLAVGLALGIGGAFGVGQLHSRARSCWCRTARAIRSPSAVSPRSLPRWRLPPACCRRSAQPASIR